MDADAAAAFIVARRERFDAATMVFHWMTAALVFVQLATGFATSLAPDAVVLERILVVHRSVGACVLGLTALRLAWRQWFAWLPPFPAHMPKLQQWAATANELALYALLLLQPVTGLGDTLFRGRSFAILAWRIPALTPRTPWLFKLLHAAHEFGAEALVALIGLHVLAALFHHLMLRDRVLDRMLP
jgi:cytochrome b561